MQVYVPEPPPPSSLEVLAWEAGLTPAELRDHLRREIQRRRRAQWTPPKPWDDQITVTRARPTQADREWVEQHPELMELVAALV